MPTFCQWYDFGVRGIPPEELVLAYDSEAEYELPPSLEQKIENTWERITEDHPGLFNGPLLNLIEVSSEERRISLGPSQFRDYQFKRLVLSNHETTTDLELTAEEQEFLREEIHVLSSFVAIILDDAVLMGVKPKNSEHGGVLSFPGSGYLDRDEDCTDDGELKPTRTVIEREIDEELNVADRITGIKCLGVFDDAEDATHYNPAIFSIVEIDATKAEVKERITDADDSWEFAEFVFFPTRREDVLDSVLELAFANEHTSGEQLPGLDVTTVDGVTTKSGLMVLLLGRFWFGTDWYIERLDRYPSLSLEVATTELGEPTSRLPTGKLTNVQNANKLELSKWVAAADEGDQTLAWVNFVGSGEEPDRVRLQFDLVEKGSVPATDSIEDDSESEHTEDDSESESTRRTLLKTIGAAIPLSSIGGIAVETQGMPEALKHFWPNALYQKESEKVLDWATLDALLFDNQLGWGKFKTQSTEMIYDPDIVTEYDDVHLLSVFFRAIDENMITAIEQSANQAKTVYLYFVHPFEHHSKDTSALELHEEIELRSFRHLFSNVHWRRFYEDVVEHPANDRVPHPDSSRLNRIRANANALRCVQMGAFLTMNHPKIEVRLIDDHEVSLRGYIVEEKKSVVRFKSEGNHRHDTPQGRFHY